MSLLIATIHIGFILCDDLTDYACFMVLVTIVIA